MELETIICLVENIKTDRESIKKEIVTMLIYYPKDKVDRESQFWEGNVEQLWVGEKAR